MGLNLLLEHSHIHQVLEGAEGIGTCHLIATIFGVFVGDANKRFNGGLADAHGGHVSPVNSSYKDMRGV
jgi:putative Mn2+ efflux pump MntP